MFRHKWPQMALKPHKSATFLHIYAENNLIVVFTH